MLLVFFWIAVFSSILLQLIKIISYSYYFLGLGLSKKFIWSVIASNVINGGTLFALAFSYLAFRYLKMLSVEVLDSLIDYIHDLNMWTYVASSILISVGTFYITTLFYLFIL